jgi:hypothetical protein
MFLMDDMIIKAKVASSICTGGVSVVGFADDDTNPSAYLTLQREVSPHKGQHQGEYYVELNGQQYGAHGGVLKCEISPARLVLTVDPRQTRIPATTICVLSDTNESQWADACRAVEVLFKGTGVVVTSSET